MAEEATLVPDGSEAEQLNAYLELLCTDPDQAARFAREHAELGDLFECIDALEHVRVPLAESLSRFSTIVNGPHAPTPPADVGSGGVTYVPLPQAMDPFELPRDFGKFRLVDEIGRGGMGVVFRAVQTDLGRTVALKMILSNHLASRNQVERFRREAEAAGRLRHAHIVAIHEVGEMHGQHFFTMDLIKGNCLADRLQKGPLAPEAAVHLLLPIVEAVAYLHEQGILHRDLKPSNIVLDEAGLPFLTDFGLAKFLEGDDTRTDTGCVLGTPSYMAPEQAAGRPDVHSTATDIYSLGAILYEMLTGRPPFKGPTPLDTLLGVIEGEPQLPIRLNPKVPPDLQTICMRCLERSPKARYPSAAALAEDLTRFLREEPLAHRDRNPWRRFRRWIRREPALASRLCGIGVAAIVLHGRWSYDGASLPYHTWNMSILAIWAFSAFVFQALSETERTAAVSRYGWPLTDALFLTLLFSTVAGRLGSLLAAYPLLIVTSGLFFRVGPVLVTTAACMLLSAPLMFLRYEDAPQWHYSIIYQVVLWLLGCVVAYQVRRTRILTRYSEQFRPTRPKTG